MRLAAAAMLAAYIAAPAHAQNAASGKAIYKTYCQVCHTVDPATAVAPFNQIMTAANNPAQISAAAAADPSQMGWIPSTLSSSQLADVAAYLGTLNGSATTLPVVEFYNV